MALPVYPAALLAAQWDKVKGVQEKPSGIGDALKALKKAYDGFDGDALDSARLAGAAELAARRDALQGAGRKSLKEISDKAAALAVLVKKWEPEYKKLPTGKTSAPAAAEAGKAAGELVASLSKALDAALADVTARHAKASAAKPAAPGDKAEPGPEFKQVRSRVLDGLRVVRANVPGAPPIEFMVCLGKTGCAVYMGKTVSASHKTLLQALLPGESGFKYHVGRCVWEEKCHTFVGDDVPGGLSKRLQAALLKLTGARLRVRVRRTSGEVEAAEGDADAVLPEEGDVPAAAAPAAAAPAAAAPDPAKALQARAAEVTAALAAAIKAGHPLAAQLKTKLAEALTGARSPDGAAAALRSVEAIARALTMPAAAAAAPRPAAAPAPALDAAWKRARDAWRSAIETVDGQINAVRGKMLASGNDDLKKIADRGLPALTDNHKTPVMRSLVEIDASQGDARRAAAARGRTAVQAFAQHIRGSAMARVLDANSKAAFGVELTIVALVGNALDGLDEALGQLAA
jgi:hypothetical protein